MAGAVLINADRVDRLEDPGTLVHIIQQGNDILFVRHGGGYVADMQHFTCLHKLGQFSFFYFHRKHDGVHVQLPKQFVVRPGRVGLAHGVAYI